MFVLHFHMKSVHKMYLSASGVTNQKCARWILVPSFFKDKEFDMKMSLNPHFFKERLAVSTLSCLFFDTSES